MAFVDLHLRLERALESGTVLTPNERLARELRRSWDQHMLIGGHHVWPRADIASVDGWLAARHARHRLQQPGLPRLPAAGEELELWLETAEPRHAALARLAAEAWRLAHDWRIDIAGAAVRATANGTLFAQWAGRFAERLQTDGLITGAELADHEPQRPTADAPRAITLLAFDHQWPALADLLRGFVSHGTAVSSMEAAPCPASSVERVELPSPAAELDACAAWARSVLERDSAARIGVIVPYLTRARTAVQRTFAQAFRDAPEAFDVTGGEPLGETAVWRVARTLLCYVHGRVHHTDLARLGRTHYLDVRPRLPSRPAFEAALADAPADDPLRRHLGRPWTAPAASLDEWASRFLAALRAAGWHGGGSVQHQAHARITERLEAIGARAAGAPLSFEQALARIDFLLAHQPFAPRHVEARVLVMGYLETVGLRFSHLWVAGLADVEWPRAPSPNPLLPAALQRAAGVPRVDAAAERRFAERLWGGWRAAAQHVVVSHGRIEGDATRHAASLVGDMPARPIEQVVATDSRRRWRSPQPVDLDTTLQAYGRPRERVSVRGGTFLLRDQAVCPFRGWAIHALDARAPIEPHDLPDARERGTLLHEVLQVLYDTDVADPHAPEMATDVVLDRYAGALPELYRAAERKRLAAIVRAWLDLERTRDPFIVERRESRAELTLGGTDLSIRIDRIDRVGDETVVIDYKSGVANLPDTTSERLTEPQLPMYALAVPDAAAVAFAELDRNRPVMRALGRVPLAGATPLDQGQWLALLERWRGQLEALMREHLDGHAAVDPARGACQFCHLHAFCRVTMP